jgi:WD40 repeat protein
MNGGDRSVQVFDASGAPLLSLKRSTARNGEAERSQVLAFSADGGRLAFATAGWDDQRAGPTGEGGLTVWDSTGKEVFNLNEPGVEFRSVALSGDGNRVAASLSLGEMIGSGGRRERGLIRVWDVDTGRTLKETELFSNAVGLDHEGTRLAACGNSSSGQHSRITIWDLATGTELGGWDTPRASYSCLAFNRDGGRLAATLSDVRGLSELVVYDIASRDLRHFGQAYERPEFNADGTRIPAYLSSFMETAKLGLWDVATGRQLLVLEGHTGIGGRCAIAFDSRGERILSTAHLSSQSAIEAKIWDASPWTGQP